MTREEFVQELVNPVNMGFTHLKFKYPGGPDYFDYRFNDVDKAVIRVTIWPEDVGIVNNEVDIILANETDSYNEDCSLCYTTTECKDPIEFKGRNAYKEAYAYLIED